MDGLIRGNFHRLAHQVEVAGSTFGGLLGGRTNRWKFPLFSTSSGNGLFFANFDFGGLEGGNANPMKFPPFSRSCDKSV